MSAGDRDTLALVLDEHALLFLDEMPDKCRCKWVPSGYSATECIQEHRAHVADVLLASDWLREQRAEAWDEGATHADREWQNSEYNNGDEGNEYWDTDVSANPYRRTTEDTGLSSDPETI